MKHKYLLILKFLICLNGFAQHPCLVSQYNFSGNANDSKGNNNGTVIGATLTVDRFGNPNSAYSFNNSMSNYIRIPHVPFHFSNYTYSVWVKMASLPPNGNAFIFLSVGGTGGDQNMQIENNQNNAALGYLTGFSLTAYNVNGNFRAGAATGYLPKINEWYHVVCTRDTNYFKVYINGCLVATSANTNGSLPSYGSSDQGAAIGARNNGTKCFNGVLDDVGMYSCALNDKEISDLYNNYKPFDAWSDTTICLNKFNPFNLKASSGYCTYRWIDISKRNITLGTDSSLLVNINKTTIFRVYNNRNDSATVTVKIGSLSDAKLGNDTSFCNSFALNLNAGIGGKYIWNTGDTTQNIIIQNAGTYIVTKTDTIGCESKDTIQVFEHRAKKPIITYDSFPCFGEEVTLGLNGNFNSILWNTNQSNNNINVKQNGIYIVETLDSNNCRSRDTVNVNFKTKAKAEFDVTPKNAPINLAFVRLQNLASNYNRLRYNFGDGFESDSLNPSHLYTKSGYYTISQIAFNNNGCNDTAYINVFYYDDFVFYIPNAFTPNDDGGNDIFMPYLNGVDTSDYELMVFNRWGELIFKSNEIKTGWDGTYKNELVQESIYLYIIKVRSATKVMYIYKGTFTLLR